ncbi:hypothetical protein [Leifsonia sp. LS-T14]|uniref:hypothetical protein n=1 Tax=unclassified Leifsonia TaxID=2663824 RepID=UPI0035A65645
MSDVTVEQVAEDAELESILTFELSARNTEVESDPDEEIEPSHVLILASKDDGKGFQVRLRTDIETREAEIVADLAVRFGLTELSAKDISEEVMLDFVNKVALMALLPYVRQSIADLTQRVFGSPLLMPLMKRGDLTFSPSDVTERKPQRA